jgi:flagellin
MRANVGAYVNRLEHAVNNLIVSETNQAAAESQIRDADFAHETSRFTRNQILSQSATAMLSQANMAPSNVLSLLG